MIIVKDTIKLFIPSNQRYVEVDTEEKALATKAKFDKEKILLWIIYTRGD